MKWLARIIGLAFVLWMTGCAVHRRAQAVIVVPRPCIVSVELTDDTECRMNEEGTKLICDHLKLNRTQNCVEWKIKEKK